MTSSREPVWRAFPWNPAAAEGGPFSAAFVSGGQGAGRFDLPTQTAGVIYFAESPAHALGEKIQDLRFQTMEDADLFEHDFRYGLVSIDLDPAIHDGVVDLCDPLQLAEFGIYPDHLAAMNRQTTQRIAAQLHSNGKAGLRWWSAFFGEWHTIVLFRDRLRQELTYHVPQHINIQHPDLAEAARLLSIEI